MSLEGQQNLAVVRVPESECGIPAGRNQTAPVRTKTHIVNFFGLPTQGKEIITAGRIPHLDRPVVACRSQTAPIGTEADGSHDRKVAIKRAVTPVELASDQAPGGLAKTLRYLLEEIPGQAQVPLAPVRFGEEQGVLRKGLRCLFCLNQGFVTHLFQFVISLRQSVVARLNEIALDREFLVGFLKFLAANQQFIIGGRQKQGSDPETDGADQKSRDETRDEGFVLAQPAPVRAVQGSGQALTGLSASQSSRSSARARGEP